MAGAPSASLVGPRQLDLRSEYLRRQAAARCRATDTRTKQLIRPAAPVAAPIARSVMTQTVGDAVERPAKARRPRLRLRPMSGLPSLWGLSLVSSGILAGLGAITLIVWLSQPQTALRPAAAPAVVKQTPQLPKPTQTPLAKAITAPVRPTDRLLIPSINLNASVTTVGLEKDLTLEAPLNLWQVGLFDRGARIGAPGTAIIDGHSGAPGQYGVLENLPLLKVGALITYHFVDGRQVVYRVTSSAAYPLTQASADRLFANTAAPTLNLISCTGTWNPRTQDYSQRWIVTADLVK